MNWYPQKRKITERQKGHMRTHKEAIYSRSQCPQHPTLLSLLASSIMGESISVYASQCWVFCSGSPRRLALVGKKSSKEFRGEAGPAVCRTQYKKKMLNACVQNHK